MPILQKALEEPLLSHAQVAVVREIARAAQLGQALKELHVLSEVIGSAQSPRWTKTESPIDKLNTYLKSEIAKTLSKIKVPLTAPETKSEVLPNAPSNGAKGNTK